MLRRIGDVILTTPAARALRKRYPRATIDFLTEPPCHEILENAPDISEVLVYRRPGRGAFSDLPAQWRQLMEIRARKYDWVIDFMGNPRSAVLTAFSAAPLRAGPGHVAHRWAYNRRWAQSPQTRYGALEKILALRRIGLDLDASDFFPKLQVRDESRRWAQSAVADSRLLPAPPLVGFVPASRRRTRRWPAASYAELGRILRKGGERILVFWGPGEEPLARDIASEIGEGAAIAPATRNLQDLAALMARCRLIVTNCNGPKHMAVALGVPTLTIHGSSDPAAWNPPGLPLHRIIRLEDLFCIGCRRNDCPYDLECMRRLPADQVARVAREMLNGLVASDS
ncbi:MAG: glycosyltransferase family 9 protein [Elusimicrobia bacterium]|nr:glycosyltransferase family 9 protein [Elusimicrobiota bacterium]